MGRLHRIYREAFAKEPLPSDVNTEAKLSTSILEKFRKTNKAAHTQQKKKKKIPKILPNIPTSASRLAGERDRISQRNLSDHRIKDINTEINNLVHNTRTKSG